MRSFLKIDRLYIVAFASFAFLLSTQLVKPVMPELTSVTSASTSQAASILSSSIVALVLFQFVSGPLADRYGNRRMVLLGVILGAITCFNTYGGLYRCCYLELGALAPIC
ncbi:MAG: MFS transporter [Candidatus Poribacteria bacterium]